MLSPATQCRVRRSTYPPSASTTALPVPRLTSTSHEGGEPTTSTSLGHPTRSTASTYPRPPSRTSLPQSPTGSSAPDPSESPSSSLPLTDPGHLPGSLRTTRRRHGPVGTRKIGRAHV